jgi:TonB-dependent starch-binding outer membrane protein SusC
MKKLILLFFMFCVFLLPLLAQQKTITGVITGAEDKLPVIGATVQIKGTNTGVATDPDGKYQISAPEGAVLEIRYVGMKTTEIIVGTSSVYNVALEYESIGIDEIVVVGYGTQIKSKVSASISKVDGEALMNLPVPTVEQALQGKTAGVYITGVNGKATGTTRMRIRGSSSITADNQPLFVVDGIPITTEALNYSGASINPLTSINFNDVQSIEILKDAASAAIYGSRGANGVVIVTTKKGTTGDTKLNFTVQTGYNEPSRKREFMDSKEYVDYFRMAAKNSDRIDDEYYGDPAGTNTYWQDETDAYLEVLSGWAAMKDSNGNYTGSSVNTDWQEEAFQRGSIYTADLSASGGTDKLRYYASGSYNTQQGILVSNGIEKISARLNVDNKVNNFIDLGFALSLNRTSIDQVSADNAFSTPMQLVALAPITPVRDKEGNLYDTPVTTYYNGLIDVEQASRKIIEYRSLFNSYLVFTLMEGLKWRNEMGFDLYNLKENARYGKNTEDGYGDKNGYGFGNYGQNQNITGKSYLDLNRTFGSIGVSAVLGTEMQYTSVEQLRAEGQQFPVDDLKTLASAGLITAATSTLTQYSFVSFFSRVNLDYRAKYLLTIAGRIDGSSRFGNENRYGTFPAASIGWVISKENFLANNNTLSFLKVRASFGQTGNAGIANFGHLGLYGVDNYNDFAGLFPMQIQNPDLGWETTTQIDGGVDFGFFKNRISGEVDVYHKNTTDLLLSVPIPTTSGYESQMQNIGSVTNTGVEFVVNSNNFTGTFTWSTSLNLSYNKNKVTDLGEQDIIDNGSARYMNVVKVGEPIGVFYGAQYAGVDVKNGDALWYVNEQDANGNIVNPSATTNNFNDANFIVLGNPTPPLMGAITNTFGYKGIEFSFTFQGVAGNDIFLVGDQWMGANGVWFDNQLKSQLRSWKKQGDVTDIPEARLYYGNGSESRNSRYLTPGSYLKLRNFMLSYELPKNIVSKIKLDRIRLYIQGQNLFMFTKYEGWDPEVSTDFLNDNVTSGCDFYSAPQPRSIVFGINIGI